jgi:hypothetical protein
LSSLTKSAGQTDLPASGQNIGFVCVIAETKKLFMEVQLEDALLVVVVT